MKRPLAVLPAAVVALSVAATACRTDTAEPETSSTVTSTVASADTAAIDQVKAGSFVIGFRGAFPAPAEGRDDAAITEVFTETCAEIRSGVTEDAAVTALAERLDNGDTAPTPDETRAVYQMVATMCGEQ